MSQQYTILFDLDGTLVDTAPDLMRAHNHVMKKFGYPTKSTEEIRNLVGQGAGAMLGRSIWGQAKKEFGKVQDKKIKEEMVKDGAVIVDVGITRVADNSAKGYKIVGDVDYQNVSKKSSYITPVPGGVGPMTIAMLLKNTLLAYKG